MDLNLPVVQLDRLPASTVKEAQSGITSTDLLPIDSSQIKVEDCDLSENSYSLDVLVIKEEDVTEEIDQNVNDVVLQSPEKKSAVSESTESLLKVKKVVPENYPAVFKKRKTSSLGTVAKKRKKPNSLKKPEIVPEGFMKCKSCDFLESVYRTSKNCRKCGVRISLNYNEDTIIPQSKVTDKKVLLSSDPLGECLLLHKSNQQNLMHSQATDGTSKSSIATLNHNNINDFEPDINLNKSNKSSLLGTNLGDSQAEILSLNYNITSDFSVSQANISSHNITDNNSEARVGLNKSNESSLLCKNIYENFKDSPAKIPHLNNYNTTSDFSENLVTVSPHKENSSLKTSENNSEDQNIVKSTLKGTSDQPNKKISFKTSKNYPQDRKITEKNNLKAVTPALMTTSNKPNKKKIFGSKHDSKKSNIILIPTPKVYGKKDCKKTKKLNETLQKKSKDDNPYLDITKYIQTDKNVNLKYLEQPKDDISSKHPTYAASNSNANESFMETYLEFIQHPSNLPPLKNLPLNDKTKKKNIKNSKKEKTLVVQLTYLSNDIMSKHLNKIDHAQKSTTLLHSSKNKSKPIGSTENKSRIQKETNDVLVHSVRKVGRPKKILNKLQERTNVFPIPKNDLTKNADVKKTNGSKNNLQISSNKYKIDIPSESLSNNFNKDVNKLCYKVPKGTLVLKEDNKKLRKPNLARVRKGRIKKIKDYRDLHGKTVKSSKNNIKNKSTISITIKHPHKEKVFSGSDLTTLNNKVQTAKRKSERKIIEYVEETVSNSKIHTSNQTSNSAKEILELNKLNQLVARETVTQRKREITKIKTKTGNLKAKAKHNKDVIGELTHSSNEPERLQTENTSKVTRNKMTRKNKIHYLKNKKSTLKLMESKYTTSNLSQMKTRSNNLEVNRYSLNKRNNVKVKHNKKNHQDEHKNIETETTHLECIPPKVTSNQLVKPTNFIEKNKTQNKESIFELKQYSISNLLHPDFKLETSQKYKKPIRQCYYCQCEVKTKAKLINHILSECKIFSSSELIECHNCDSHDYNNKNCKNCPSKCDMEGCTFSTWFKKCMTEHKENNNHYFRCKKCHLKTKNVLEHKTHVCVQNLDVAKKYNEENFNIIFKDNSIGSESPKANSTYNPFWDDTKVTESQSKIMFGQNAKESTGMKPDTNRDSRNSKELKTCRNCGYVSKRVDILQHCPQCHFRHLDRMANLKHLDTNRKKLRTCQNCGFVSKKIKILKYCRKCNFKHTDRIKKFSNLKRTHVQQETTSKVDHISTESNTFRTCQNCGFVSEKVNNASICQICHFKQLNEEQELISLRTCQNCGYVSRTSKFLTHCSKCNFKHWDRIQENCILDLKNNKPSRKTVDNLNFLENSSKPNHTSLNKKESDQLTLYPSVKKSGQEIKGFITVEYLDGQNKAENSSQQKFVVEDLDDQHSEDSCLQKEDFITVEDSNGQNKAENSSQQKVVEVLEGQNTEDSCQQKQNLITAHDLYVQNTAKKSYHQQKESCFPGEDLNKAESLTAIEHLEDSQNNIEIIFEDDLGVQNMFDSENIHLFHALSADCKLDF